MLFCLLVVGCANSDELTASIRPESLATPIDDPAVPNLHQVNGWLFRSAQPNKENFKQLEGMGIKTVVNLRSMHSDSLNLADTSLELIEIPIITWSFSDHEIAAALRAIAVRAKRPVLVHCMHGADRTGLVIALYRVIFESWSKEQAKAEMLEGGYGFHSMWDNITNYLDTVDIELLRQNVMAD